MFHKRKKFCAKRIFRWSLAFVILTSIAVNLSAQDQTLKQLWANFTLNHERSAKLLLELDIQHKTQISGGDPWKEMNMTANVEYHPTDWMELMGELVFGYTDLTQNLRSFEFTPRIGVRFHLFSKVQDRHRPERIPLPRIWLASLFRLEYRNLNYFGDLESTHQFRFRGRLELKMPLNHKKLSTDGTLYLKSDAEFFVKLDDDIPERFASKSRFRFGLGYRFSHKWRAELLYIKDLSRDLLGEEFDIDSNILNLRVKMVF